MARFSHRMGRPPVQGEQVPIDSYLGPGDVEKDPSPVTYASLISGGMRSVQTMADLTDRIAIPDNMREVGMLAYVQSVNRTYQLTADLVTWVEFAGAGAGASGGTFLRRSFQNATSVTLFDVLEFPVVEIWFETGTEVLRPLIYNEEDGVYGLAAYHTSAVEGLEIDNDLTNINARVSYLPALAELFIQFDAPKSGVVVAGF